MSNIDQLRIECIKCSKLLSHPDQPNTSIQGILFEGSGGYGSSYDYSNKLMIAVCDDCVTSAAEDKNKILIVEQPRVVTNYKPVQNTSDLHGNNY